jgi:hypothetical protein
MSSWRIRIAIALLAIIAVAASALAVTQLAWLNEAEHDNEQLQEDLAATKERVDELEDAAASAEDQNAGDSSTGDVGGLEDLFGGEEGLGDLFSGSGAADLLRCLSPAEGGTEDALGGLLESIAEGEQPNPDKALEGLFGGLAPSEGSDRPGRAEIAAISRAVEKIRKLRFKQRVDATFLAPDELAERATRLFLRDYPPADAEDEQRLLVALGAIPPGTDLRQLTKRLLETQVAGFYVPKTSRLFVPGAPNKPLSATEKSIVAHELEHAVADQRLEIPLPHQPDPREIDANLATLAVIEGDASLTMQRYTLAYIPVFEQLSMLNDPAYAQAQAALEDIPHYLVEQLSFPYIDGLEFTCHLYSNGGWNAVNRAYDNPPDTTAQVLFPDRYRKHERPVDPGDPKTPPGDWTPAFSGTFGAANLMWLFEAPGGDESLALSDPRRRVATWAGGEVHVWSRGADSAVALRVAERPGADGLCDSIKEWYDLAFDDDDDTTTTRDELSFDGPVQDALVRCSEDEVQVGMGPDLTTARSLTG